MAGTSPSTTERAAAAGMGVLFFSHGVAPEELSVSVERYRSGIAAANPIGRAVNNRLAGFCIGLCGEDDAETREVGGRAAFEYLTRGTQNSIWDDPPPPTLEYTAQFHAGLERMRRAGPDVMIERKMLMAGNPDRCNALVREYADLGVDQLIIHMQNWDLPHERIMESIRTFGTHVIPEYTRR
jgi:alkanesulfonate monooxygenase SsuD/methylene tetrahydromethanopterin reductase-like flavin-dependent oxidoreductase (luciferase family)